MGSFVSGFAFLISLIYLALQVRQTERNQQISIRHSRVSRTVHGSRSTEDDDWRYLRGNCKETVPLGVGAEAK